MDIEHPQHQPHLQAVTEPQKSTETTNISSDGYNSFTTPDGNIVWAGALTLAWQQMAQSTAEKQLHVSKSQEIADNYNKSPFTRDHLSESSYYIKSGKGQETVEQINRQRAQKFKECTFPPLSIDLLPEAYISYSYLYKKVNYSFKFQRKEQLSLRFKCKEGGEKLVPSFYAEDDRQYEQVKVYEYNSDNDFILRLVTENDNEEIFAYKVEEGKSVKEVIEKITEVSGKTEEIYSVADTESFQFPVLDFDYSRSVQQLLGAQLTNLDNVTIEGMIEAVKLKLDENGVVVQNEGLMFTDECGVFNPRVMRVDSPFWLVMKEKGKHPYLCVRVNNL